MSEEPVYDGIYEPGHPLANQEGFRTDVIDLVRELGVSTIRYPGGNFVSGYRWEDGVGPRESRPTRRDLAWHSTETNEIGLDEFARWLQLVGSELMYAVNLGTRGVLEALDVLEYANHVAGTALSDARVANGATDPYAIKMWCLGNEMDGPWQLGHSTAEDYANLAAKTAAAMRQVDPSLELVVCGSSGSSMPTFGAWERTVLNRTYDDVDFISCHAYYEPDNGDVNSFLAAGVDMDRFITTVTNIADEVKAQRGSDKTINISFDEWNVWYLSRFRNEDRLTDPDNWPIAPRLLEDHYSVLDAVVFGSLLITLLRHADRVTSASLAQLVNVIAPIMTEPGGPAWRQTTYYPFAVTSRLATGTSLRLDIQSPTYATSRYGAVPAVDAAASRDETSGTVALFLVNRDQQEAISVTTDLKKFGVASIQEAHLLHDPDLSAQNTLKEPYRIRPTRANAVVVGGALTIELPPVSWVAISLQ